MTSFSPITRRRIAAFSITLLPIGLWFLTATFASGMAFSQWNFDAVLYFAKITPEHPMLYLALAVGLVIALAIIIFMGKASRSKGFDGAGYKRFIRGTRSVSAKKLAKLCKEPHTKQVNVAKIPMPIKVENLHLMIGGATGSGKSVLLRGLASSVHKRGDRMIVIDPNGDLMSKFWKDGDVILNPYD